jgi:hypothetical protein
MPGEDFLSWAHERYALTGCLHDLLDYGEWNLFEMGSCFEHDEWLLMLGRFLLS